MIEPTPVEQEVARTRRDVLGKAAVGLAAAGGAASLAGRAEAAPSPRALKGVVDFIATQEAFGVTFLTEGIRRSPGTPSAQFAPILKAANTTEFDHLRALEQRLGAKRLVKQYWIPEAAFDNGGPGLFQSIDKVETIELSMYLIGVTAYAQRRSAFGARLMAEAMATESEHRVLARAALGMLGVKIEVPNNISFAPFNIRTVAGVKAAAERLGIGYDKEGAQPGKFYPYPGNPLANGSGSPQIVRTPA